MKQKLIRPIFIYVLLALTLGVVVFYLISSIELTRNTASWTEPTPTPTPKLIPKPPSTIDFDYQIIRVVGSSYSVSSDRNKTPIVISSRVELEEFYHSAYADVDIGTTNIREYIPHPDADAFWEAIEVYTDTFFAENYLVIFEEDLSGGSYLLLHEIAWIDYEGNILVNRVTDGTYSNGDKWDVVIEIKNSFKPERFKIISQNLPIIATPTPKPTPTLVPMPVTTIDFDYQIFWPGNEYKSNIPTVISSRADLEDFYHFAYPYAFKYPGDFEYQNDFEYQMGYSSQARADLFWEAIELHTDTFFEENYLVIFASEVIGARELFEIAWIDDNGNILINGQWGYADGNLGYMCIVIALKNSFKPEQFNVSWQYMSPERFTPTRTLSPVIEKKMLDDFLLYKDHIEKYNREDLYIDWYFGRYSGCEAAVIGGIKDDAESAFDIAVYVYKDASFMLHEDAQEAGWITRSDLKRINEWRHLRARIVRKTKVEQ